MGCALLLSPLFLVAVACSVVVDYGPPPLRKGDGMTSVISTTLLRGLYQAPGVTSTSATLFTVTNPGAEGVMRVLAANGCAGPAETVVQMAERAGCTLAVNGGFFDRGKGSCKGTVVSGSKVLSASKEMTAVLARLRDGRLASGYLRDLSGVDEALSGLVWLVRGGEVNVDRARRDEEAPSLDQNFEEFIAIRAPRLAAGWRADGTMMILVADGFEHTHQQGLNLHELARLLVAHGAVEAVNLDGGGSVTAVLDGVVVNSPSDLCDGQPDEKHGGDVRCPRPVASALCITAELPRPPFRVGAAGKSSRDQAFDHPYVLLGIFAILVSIVFLVAAVLHYWVKKNRHDTGETREQGEEEEFESIVSA